MNAAVLGLQNRILNWLIAIFLVSNSLCWGLSFLPNPMVLIMAAVLVTYLIINLNALADARCWKLCAVTLILFLIGYLYRGVTEYWLTYLIEFLMVGMTGVFLGVAHFDIVKVFRYICYLSVPTALVMLQMDFADMDYGAWMGVSYGCLKYIVVFLIALMGGLNVLPTKWHKIAAIFLMLYYLQFFLRYGSRGAILGILAAIFMILAVRKRYSLKKVMLTLSIVIIAVVAGWNTIFPAVVKFALRHNIESFAIDKMAVAKDLSNGRENLVEQGFEIFQQSPILGSGTGTFEAVHQGYSHNVFIEIMCDGGIIYLSLFVLMIGAALTMAFNKSNPLSVKLFMVFLIAGYLVELLFSNYLWRSHGLWLMFGFTISHYKQFKANKLFGLKV